MMSKKISRERTDRLVGFSRADGTALSGWNDGIGTVSQVLTDDLVTQHCPRVAHADTAWFWLPYSIVCILLAILDAAAELFLCSHQKGATEWSA